MTACLPSIGEGIAGGPGIPQLTAILPLAAAHTLIHHAAVVPRWVAEQPGRAVAQPLVSHGVAVLPA